MKGLFQYAMLNQPERLVYFKDTKGCSLPIKKYRTSQVWPRLVMPLGQFI